MPSVEDLVALADHPRIIGIGESGLDYFYDKSPRDLQARGLPPAHPRGARRRPAAGHPCPPGG